jgi:hypothetical protein
MIQPLTMELNGVKLGHPARVGNAWVYSDWRIPHGQLTLTDPVQPIDPNAQPTALEGHGPQGSPQGGLPNV